MENYIDLDWLRAVNRTVFYYPAAGEDFEEPIIFFQDYIDEYWFCDVNYHRALKLRAAISEEYNFEIVHALRDGQLGARKTWRVDTDGRRYPYLEPSRLTESYRRKDGKTLTVIRRRGYGEIGLSKEFQLNSIGVFMHRGDSTSEGGSRVEFLADKKKNFEPTGMLFTKLAERLRNKALIISDGSNSDIPWIKMYHHTAMTGHAAYQSHQSKIYQLGGFSWRCVGWLKKKYGPTLIWGGTRDSNES